MSDQKEPAFFSEDSNWSKGMDWYERFFEEAGDARAVGEASTTYSMFPLFDAAARIARVLPGSRLIYLVRHPIERIFSQYKFLLARGYESRPIEEALLQRDADGNPSLYVSGSMYALQIKRYLNFFSRDQLLIIKSEELRSRRSQTLNRILDFLEVDSDWASDVRAKELNAGSALKAVRAKSLAPRESTIPGYRQLARVLPESIKKIARRLILTRAPDPPVEEYLRRELENQVRDDVRRLYPYMEPGFDGWRLA